MKMAERDSPVKYCINFYLSDTSLSLLLLQGLEMVEKCEGDGFLVVPLTPLIYIILTLIRQVAMHCNAASRVRSLLITYNSIALGHDDDLPAWDVVFAQRFSHQALGFAVGVNVCCIPGVDPAVVGGF